MHDRTFCFVTDQGSMAFMLDPLKGTKFKNNYILFSLRTALGTFSYRVEHTPGVAYVVPDALSRPLWNDSCRSGRGFIKVESRSSR